LSLLNRIFRSNPFNNPNYPMTTENVNGWLDMMGGSHSDSGELVNTHNAMQTTTVWACVNFISSQMAVNSLFLYEVDEEGNKTLAADHDYFDLLTKRPNQEMDAASFRTAVQVSALLHGNGYIELVRNNAARVVAMWPRSGHCTRPARLPSGDYGFITSDSDDGRERFVSAENMIRIMGLTVDGRSGLSPIMYHAQTIGRKIAMEKFGARFFANSATPSGILSTTQKVKPEDKTKMRSDWEALQSGRNQHRVAVLDQELKFQQISIPQDEAQYLETLNATDKQIAQMYAVPAAAIGLLDKGIKANVEQQMRDAYNYCLRPWMERWEIAFNTTLFASVGRSAGRYIVEYSTRKLLMGDNESRLKYYQSMIQNGVLSPNEVRNLEGYNQIPDGNGHYIQLNMQTLAFANTTDPVPDGPNTELAMEMEENNFKRLGASYRGLFKDGVRRFIRRGAADKKTAALCLWPVLESIAIGMRQNSALEDTEVLTSTEETYKAIAKLVDGFAHRSKEWAEADVDKICTTELKRAVKSLIFATGQDVANHLSRKAVAELEAEDADTTEELIEE
jgi:HK97 family phage portal protein